MWFYLVVELCDPPCKNGGVCDNKQCFCPSGYTGKVCEEGKRTFRH